MDNQFTERDEIKQLRSILKSIVDDYRHDGGAVAEIFIKRAEAALAKKQEKR